MDKFGAIQSENMKALKRKGLSERDAVLVSLKNKAKKGQDNEVPGPSSSMSDEKFPYGTRINLENEHVKALGLHKLKPGQKVHISGKAHVTSTSVDERQGGKPRHSVSLQITHMAPMGSKGYTNPDSNDDLDGEEQD